MQFLYRFIYRKEALAHRTKYARNPWTHIDFLFFNKMDKRPVFSVEVDGTAFHAAESRQAQRDAMKDVILGKVSLPVVRLRTDEVVNETVFGQILRTQLESETNGCLSRQK